MSERNYGCGPIHAHSAHNVYDSNDRSDSLVYSKRADNHFVSDHL